MGYVAFMLFQVLYDNKFIDKIYELELIDYLLEYILNVYKV